MTDNNDRFVYCDAFIISTMANYLLLLSYLRSSLSVDNLPINILIIKT